MKTFTLLSSLFFLLLTGSLSAQTDVQILGVELTLAGSGTDINPTDTFSVKVVAVVNDTVNTSKLHVTLTDPSGSQTYISRSFDFDVTTGLPAGTSFLREGNLVTLTIGKFWEQGGYKVNLRREDGQGNFGTAAVY